MTRNYLPKLPQFPIRLCTIMICGTFIFGCVFPPQQTVKQTDSPRDSVRMLTPEHTESDQRLIKPTIPSDNESDDQERPLPQLKPLVPEKALQGTEPSADQTVASEKQAPEQKVSAPPVPNVMEPPKEAPHAIVPESKPQQRLEHKESGPAAYSPKPTATDPQNHIGDRTGKDWEDQKVRAAAHELAKSYSGVKKIKVCYSVKDDEWWVTLYDFTGSYIDLKQFTWNRDLDKLESFLVLNRIPLSRLQNHLNEEQSGRACEVLETAANPVPAGN